MESTIPTQFWGLYAAGELKRVQQFCELGKALELLASNAEDQESSIPDCPACEVWGGGFGVLQQFIENFPDPLPSDFTDAIQRLYELGGGLSEGALRCWDRRIFSSPEWAPIRAEANKALAMLGWGSLMNHADELLKECRGGY